jgi:hypothetical protein
MSRERKRKGSEVRKKGGERGEGGRELRKPGSEEIRKSGW